MNILRLLAELGLNAAPFNKGMDSAKARAGASAREIGAGFKRAFGQYLGAAAIIQTFRGIAREIDNIEDSSQRLGLTTEQFQRLSIAADRAGQSLQGGKGVGKVFNEIAELRAKAEGGDIKASKQLGELGLSMLGAADASETMHDAFAKVINLSDTKLAEVFGGRVLLDIKALREEMKNVANESIFTAEQISKVKAMDEQIKSTKRTIDFGLATAFVTWAKIGKAFFTGQRLNPASFMTQEEWEAAGAVAREPPLNRKGFDPNAEARAKAIAETQRQIADLLASAKQQPGRNVSDYISATAGRFGVSAALIGTAAAVERPKPLNPELRKKLDDLIRYVEDLKNQGRDVIKFPR